MKEEIKRWWKNLWNTELQRPFFGYYNGKFGYHAKELPKDFKLEPCKIEKPV